MLSKKQPDVFVTTYNHASIVMMHGAPEIS